MPIYARRSDTTRKSGEIYARRSGVTRRIGRAYGRRSGVTRIVYTGLDIAFNPSSTTSALIFADFAFGAATAIGGIVFRGDGSFQRWIESSPNVGSLVNAGNWATPLGRVNIADYEFRMVRTGGNQLQLAQFGSTPINVWTRGADFLTYNISRDSSLPGLSTFTGTLFVRRFGSTTILSTLSVNLRAEIIEEPPGGGFGGGNFNG